MKNIAFIFPGQGSQYVGMGKEIYYSYPIAKNIFEKANKYLPITDFCFNGPLDVLTQTKNTQPCIFTTSIAFYEILKSFNITPSIVAGHSLGEYSALVASSILNFEDGLKLVIKRGSLMQEIGLKTKGTMAAVIGLNKEIILDSLNNLVVDIANLNSQEQIIISGKKEDILKAIDILKQKGAKKIIPLTVSGAFHSRLMQPMEQEFVEELKKVNFAIPKIKFIPNVIADYIDNPEEIKNLLIKQITHSVRWLETIQKMVSDGIKIFVEIGPGKVLSGLVKRIAQDVNVLNIENISSLEKTIEFLKNKE